MFILWIDGIYLQPILYYFDYHTKHEKMAEDVQYCPLHECVFSGDVRKLSALLRLNDVAKKDKHGMFMLKYLY